jgi:signal transduction histidine kinase
VRLSRLPLRSRLVAGFAGAMLVVLLAAGAFVWWRVQVALDHRLDQDLQAQSDDLVAAARRAAPAAALASLRDEGRRSQLLDAQGRVLASGAAIPDGAPLLDARQAARAAGGAQVRAGRGHLLSARDGHLRIVAVPVAGPGATAVAASAVSLDQRDEALRELLAQLTIANLLALAVASLVGYRLARAALDPVERYRAQAARIAAGATGVRLDVPDEPADEITRLGHTLNTMLDAQERAAERQEQFIHDASHDLRTPIATLAAEIDLALRKPRTVEEHEATLRRLADDTQQLVALAETLLALGALGSTAPQACDVAAQELVGRAARRARAQLDPDDGRRVVEHVPDGLVVHGDPALLDRALGNMVDNAVRYGDGDIDVSAAGRAGGVTSLAVHDGGPGIDADFLPHAAERFRRHESSRTAEGTGLGLALVDAIAAAHGGQLRICAGDRHHAQHAPDPAIGWLPCEHARDGTTVSLLLPAAAAPR